jgi:hypothetical protein
MSFSGYISDLTEEWSSGNIISTTKFTTGVATQALAGNYGRVILGHLLVQFGTGYNSKNSEVTLPVEYSAGTGNDTGWREPYLLFAQPWSANFDLYIVSKNTNKFSIAGMGSSNIFYNWITIGPIPSNYAGT